MNIEERLNEVEQATQQDHQRIAVLENMQSQHVTVALELLQGKTEMQEEKITELQADAKVCEQDAKMLNKTAAEFRTFLLRGRDEVNALKGYAAQLAQEIAWLREQRWLIIEDLANLKGQIRIEREERQADRVWLDRALSALEIMREGK
jgi:chromosome segregation ATPase